MKRIVILGAGYGGVSAALRLQKRLRRARDVEIVLIDRNHVHTLLTELHEVAGNRVSEDAIVVPLDKIFQYTKVKVVADEVESVDFNANVVKAVGGEYPYDYLVVAMGSKPAYFGIEGMEEHGLALWSYEDAIKAREHIRSMFRQAAREKNPARRRELLTFVVGGGGFTGIELVGELARWRQELCAEFGISRTDVRLMVVEAMDKCLTVLDDNLVAKAMNHLDKLGVEVWTNSPIVKVSPDAIELKGGQAIGSHTLIWTGGCETATCAAELGLETAGRGRIVVNEYLQTQHPNVYAIGDNSFFVANNGQPLPALVEPALQGGQVAADNIIAELRGKEKQPYKPNIHGVMVSVGRWYGVADLMGIKLSGFLAIFMKHMVNLHYLFGIGGFDIVFAYLAHEFKDQRKRDWHVVKHLWADSQLFWLVPLRLYLGYMWLKSGIDKINSGWLREIMISGAADGGSSITASAISAASDVAATSGVTAASAVAAATEAVTAGVTAATEVAATAGVSAASSVATTAATLATDGTTGASIMNLISDHTPGWYAWMVNNIVVPNAMVFQYMVTITEIVLGVAFILGLFTFIAAAISVVMNINFLLSTGLYDYWFLMTSIAMMAGAGRAFGLDYYVYPYLQRQWRYLVRNRRPKVFLFR